MRIPIRHESHRHVGITSQAAAIVIVAIVSVTALAISEMVTGNLLVPRSQSTTQQTSTIVLTATSTLTSTTTTTVSATAPAAIAITAQVSAVNAAIKATTVTSTSPASITFTCTADSTNGALAFSNLGTVNANILSLSITFGGTTYSGTAPSPCSINAGSNLAISFATLGIPNPLPSSGTQYAGFVVLSNGAQVVFTGAFL